MTKTTVYCDACSRLIESDRTCLEVETGPLLRRGIETVDLCPVCLERFAAMLSGPSPDLAQPPASAPLAGAVARSA